MKRRFVISTLLEAKKVTKIYGKSGHSSLNKISFYVAEGEFIGIMGASGSGKTTLLNVLSTINTPTRRDIWINGVNLKNLNHTSAAADFRKDNLGFIFQEYFLLDSLTICENISVPLTLQKLPPKQKLCSAISYGCHIRPTLWSQQNLSLCRRFWNQYTVQTRTAAKQHKTSVLQSNYN